MELQNLQLLVIAISFALLIRQLFVKDKKAVHILFAVFCGSITMVVAKKITGNSIGAYQHLIGMGTCATCNCYWLLSRAMFRESPAFSRRHFLMAGAIGVIITLSYGYKFVRDLYAVDSTFLNSANGVLIELLIMLSSCILVLTFWEGCRGYSRLTSAQKHQRILFLSMFGLAVGICKIVEGYFVSDPVYHEWAVNIVTLLVLISTQCLIYWRFEQQEPKLFETGNIAGPMKLELVLQSSTDSNDNHILSSEDKVLATALKQMLFTKKCFLTPNLKVSDLARELDVPEYRVSKVLRYQLNARNFNQFINELRVEHAQSLLLDPKTKQWPVLVIGLESGFASIAPFTRAFKNITGTTPNLYRQQSNQLTD